MKTENIDTSFSIRPLHSIDELSEVCLLEKLIWASDDPVPVSHALTAIKNGGMVLGAFNGRELIGFQYSFAGFNENKTYLCSHILGIHPQFRSGGIGEKLKRAQRNEAIQKGYDLISWTFDPLESINANLNIKKLGAICSTYLENCYGEMPDALNEGIPSDRFQVEWWIQCDRVIQKLGNHQKNQYSLLHTPQVIKVDINEQGMPVPVQIDCQSETYSGELLIPIPGEFQKIKDADLHLALDWRMKTRSIFNHYFQNGWHVTDFVKSNAVDVHALDTIHYYVLKK